MFSAGVSVNFLQFGLKINGSRKDKFYQVNKLAVFNMKMKPGDI